MQVLGFLSGALDGAARGGAAGLACGPLVEVCSPVGAATGAAIEGVAGAQIAGALADASWAASHPFQNDNAGSSSGDEGQSAKQYKKLSDGEIKQLKENGFHPHEIKSQPASRYDLYKDRAGNVYEMLKNGKGEANDLNINLNDLK